MARSRLMTLTVAVFLCCLGLYYYGHIRSLYEEFAKTKTQVEGTRIEQPPDQPPYGAVVAASRDGEDLSWMTTSSLMKEYVNKQDTTHRLTNFINESWTLYPYNVSNPQNPDTRLQIPKSKGHEAMVYLSYLISNYDSLPWCTFFIHGHFLSWHQETPISRLINNLNRTALAREGYISLRCDWYPSCPAEIRPYAHDAVVWGPGIQHRETELAIAGNWKQLFPEEKLPETIASPCCAQFAVTRAAIRRRSKHEYVRMRDWLLATLLEDEVSGRVFEKLWAYIFTGDAVQYVVSNCIHVSIGAKHRQLPTAPTVRLRVFWSVRRS